ncbi:MAG: hypothetical protein LBG77_06265 [Dysgonamonadaceae bacterium]|nr:hypothetical protein [Dysgonamonadaceae bacterium]
MLNWNEELVKVLNSSFLENCVVDSLMNSLHISRAAAYRRLNGTTPFLFEEAVVLSQKFDFSIDQILRQTPQHQMWCAIPDHTGNPVWQYKDLLVRMRNTLRTVAKSKVQRMMMILNELPFRYTLSPALAKLDYAIFLYHHNAIVFHDTFADIHVPADIVELQKECFYYFNEIHNVDVIFDQNFIENIIQKIKYFHAIDFLSDNEMAMLIEETRAVVQFYIDILELGYNRRGCKYNVYYSMINLHLTTIYLNYDDKDLLQLWFADGDPIIIEDNISASVWAAFNQSIRLKYASLLTHSNALLRRELVRKMQSSLDTISPVKNHVINFF